MKEKYSGEFEGYELQGSSLNVQDSIIEIVDLSKLSSTLKQSWKTIVCCVAVFVMFGLVVAFSLPKKYTVVSKVAPELSNSATNRLSSLTTMLGMNANILGSTDAVYPMVYPDIISSVHFISGLFDTEVIFTENKEKVQTTLYDYFLNHQKAPWWGAVLSLPGKLVALFKDEESEEGDTRVDPFSLNREQYRVYKAILGSIKVELDKKTLSITTYITTQDPLVAATLSKSVNEHLVNTVTKYRTSKASRDVEYYERLYDEAKLDYHKAQAIYADYADRNQALISRRSQIESERLRNEANLSFQLYNSIAQQLQTAKAKVQLETPVLAEIIPPSVPLKASGPSKKIILAVFLVLGFVTGVAVAFLKK